MCWLKTATIARTKKADYELSLHQNSPTCICSFKSIFWGSPEETPKGFQGREESRAEGVKLYCRHHTGTIFTTLNDLSFLSPSHLPSTSYTYQNHSLSLVNLPVPCMPPSDSPPYSPILPDLSLTVLSICRSLSSQLFISQPSPTSLLVPSNVNQLQHKIRKS
jgi:hypothetical protein